MVESSSGLSSSIIPADLCGNLCSMVISWKSTKARIRFKKIIEKNSERPGCLPEEASRIKRSRICLHGECLNSGKDPFKKVKVSPTDRCRNYGKLWGLSSPSDRDDSWRPSWDGKTKCRTICLGHECFKSRRINPWFNALQLQRSKVSRAVFWVSEIPAVFNG